MKRRGLRIPLSIGKIRVAQHLNKILQRGTHDDLVVESAKNVLQNAVEQEESLGGLVTENSR